MRTIWCGITSAPPGPTAKTADPTGALVVFVGVGVGISVEVEVADDVGVAVGAFEVSVGELVTEGVKVGPPGVIVSVGVGPPGVLDDVAFEVGMGVFVGVGVEDGPLGDFVRVEAGAAVKVRVGFLIVPGGRTTMVNVGNGVAVGKKVGRAVGVSENAGADVEVEASVSVAGRGLALPYLNKMPSRMATPQANSNRINAMVATCVERLLKLTFIGVEPFLRHRSTTRFVLRAERADMFPSNRAQHRRKVNFAAPVYFSTLIAKRRRVKKINRGDEPARVRLLDRDGLRQ